MPLRDVPRLLRQPPKLFGLASPGFGYEAVILRVLANRLRIPATVLVSRAHGFRLLAVLLLDVLVRHVPSSLSRERVRADDSNSLGLRHLE